MSAPLIVVTRRLPASAISLLEGGAELWVSPHERALSREELLESVRGAEAIVSLLYDRIDSSVLEAAGDGLRCVANVAVGYDNIDVAAAAARSVVVTNTPGVLTAATADLTIALMLALTRRLGEGERLIRSETPWSWDIGFMLGSELAGKTLGIVGLGEIGRAAGERARAFGMRVVYSARRQAPPATERALGGALHLPFDQLLAEADVVSLHCPLTVETRHLIDARALALMKEDAFLINTARGPIVDERALAVALADGTIAGAALDVFENEPEVTSALLALENAVLVPHLGSATAETRAAMAELAARNVRAVLQGEPSLTPVPISST